MITKNGSILLVNLYWGNITTPANTYRDINGNLWNNTVSTSVVRINLFDPSRGISVMVGTGDSTPSFNDYALDSTDVGGVDINTLVSITNGTITFDGMGQYNITFTITNTSNQDVTIKEVGIIENGSSGALKMMIARNVIPAKTLAPSDTVTFTYTLSLFEL